MHVSIPNHSMGGSQQRTGFTGATILRAHGSVVGVLARVVRDADQLGVESVHELCRRQSLVSDAAPRERLE